ncbi:MAG TPA: hypothetical protein VMY42_00590 [Thermoguttaceae bacterium]|nr:hypothetical protein [Thermoguttaceae bacterium]
MDLATQIDSHRYLDLSHIDEPEENVLRLIIEEARTGGPADDIHIGGKVITGLTSIETTDNCAAYEIRFDSYVGYSVRNESFTSRDEYEEFSGRLFRIYRKSRFLDYVRAATFASADYPGPFVHYGIICLRHIVDVAVADAPQITQVRGL